MQGGCRTLSWCMEKATFEGSSTAPATTWCSNLYLSRYACKRVVSVRLRPWTEAMLTHSFVDEEQNDIVASWHFVERWQIGSTVVKRPEDASPGNSP